MRLIGVHGQKGHGKDTLAEMVEDILSLDEVSVKRTGFAHKLKLSAYRLFRPDGTLEEALEWADWLKTHGEVSIHDARYVPWRYHVTGREFLQNFGTEAHRDVFGGDFWIDQVLPTPTGSPNWHVERGYDDVDVLLITDVRFPNEGQRILDLGGEIWRVVRSDQDKGDGHASEVPLPESMVSRVIKNDGTLGDLRRKVYALLDASTSD